MVSARMSGGLWILHTHREVVHRLVLACYGKVVLVLRIVERLGCLVLLLDGLLVCMLDLVGHLLDSDNMAYKVDNVPRICQIFLRAVSEMRDVESSLGVAGAYEGNIWKTERIENGLPIVNGPPQNYVPPTPRPATGAAAVLP
ncbi:hypothetical protein H4582DRAFT_2056178 [Lactarius indigo]|nr:hypothetical protein H4582DRAFT_2056178 [Lactarius indigo]